MRARRPEADLDRRLRTLEAGVRPSGSWRTPTLLNTWEDYGGSLQVARYRREGNLVRLRGMVKNADSGEAFSPMFTLPETFRPPASVNFAVVANNNFARVEITAAGDVYVSSAVSGSPEAFVSLDGIAFSTSA